VKVQSRRVGRRGTERQTDRKNRQKDQTIITGKETRDGQVMVKMERMARTSSSDPPPTPTAPLLLLSLSLSSQPPSGMSRPQ
jgi:hypothetical protein